eukprot:SAG25_NODE_2268_length_1768_cov_1.687837_2_plen_313_part_00
MFAAPRLAVDGESHGWPRVSSAYGQFDLAGFIKRNGEWYRTWWLSAVSSEDAGRPARIDTHACSVWGDGVLTPWKAQLFVNDKLTATAVASPLQELQLPISTVPGGLNSNNVTVLCVDRSGKPTGPALRLRSVDPSKPNATALVLTIDAPNVSKGTGSALVLDGHDVAMLRVTLVDENGTLVRTARNNVTFSIHSGPGRVIASHNGDPTCHTPNNVGWHAAYGGLVRGYVQVTEHRVGTMMARQLLASIDLETAHTTVPMSGGVVPIVVVASSPGLESATLEIPVSADGELDGVLASAQRSMARDAPVQNWD